MAQLPNGKCIFEGCESEGQHISLAFQQQGTGNHFADDAVCLCDTHLQLIEGSGRQKFHLNWEKVSELPPSKNYSLPVKITRVARKNK